MTLFIFGSGVITGVLLWALIMLLLEIRRLGSDIESEHERERIDETLDRWWTQERNRKRRESARWN